MTFGDHVRRKDATEKGSAEASVSIADTMHGLPMRKGTLGPYVVVPEKLNHNDCDGQGKCAWTTCDVGHPLSEMCRPSFRSTN
jgi:hypothetical protein